MINPLDVIPLTVLDGVQAFITAHPVVCQSVATAGIFGLLLALLLFLISHADILETQVISPLSGRIFKARGK